MGRTVASLLLTAALAASCTGGKESSAAEEKAPEKNVPQAQDSGSVDARRELRSLSPAIPVYAGARYRDDLTRRDAVMIRNRYGSEADVYTLATNDSYPQVYHYYTTYLAQFRAFPPQNPYPPEQQSWRTLEVQLDQAMQDPFIPGEAFPKQDRRVILQIAETEAEPKTVIRYIVAPAAPEALATAEGNGAGQPVTQ